LDGKMIFLNQAGQQMLGIKPEAVENTYILEVIPETLHKIAQQEILPALLKGEHWQG